MKHERLSQALGEISDAHIAEASRPKKKLRPVWFGAVAAVLAAAVLAIVLTKPMTASATGLIAAPTYPELVPLSEDNWDAYRDSQMAQYDQPDGYANSALPFFHLSTTTLLSGAEGENTVCSPVNLYLALAMLAESTGGETQQEILDALGSSSIGTLRTQAGHVWNGHYRSDGISEVVLANSLWLDDAYGYTQSTVDTLAEDYYASVYRGDLGSQEMNKALRDWLNTQTHGLLEAYAEDVSQRQGCLMALASTVYYNVQWSTKFNEEKNREDVFHAPKGDTDVTYLRRDEMNTYYRGENYGAVYERLQDGSKMWLILPDEGIGPEQLVREGHALDLILGTGKAINQSEPIVHLWLPKFDIASDNGLLDDFEALGITSAQDPSRADFTPLIPDKELWPYVEDASHAARVTVDENGVTAAAYTVIMAESAAADPSEADEIDFILDRPFLFVIESKDGLPLFAGIVNEP